MDEENFIVCEEGEIYKSNIDYPFNAETYKIIGACMSVHTELGAGFNEIIYKDALEIEFEMRDIHFRREEEFNVFYKGIQLRRKYYADFIALDHVVLEIKAGRDPMESFYKQTINYLKVSKLRIALIVNFGTDKLQYKRVIFNHDKK